MICRRESRKPVMSLVIRGSSKVVLASILALSMGKVYAAETPAPVYTPSNTSDGAVPKTSQGNLYTYERVDIKGPDTVTKFQYNNEKQTFEPVYYRMVLKNKTYGEGNASKGYGFTTNSDGNVVLGEGSTYTVKYDDAAGKTYANVYQDKIKENSVTDTDFADSEEVSAYGNYTDADFESGKIENALFQNNSAKAESNVTNYKYKFYQNGGALSVTQDMESITADFIGNSVEVSRTSSGYAYAQGGAIYNEANIGSISGIFKDNSASATPSSYAYGGAIYNNGKIGSIDGVFINNSATGYGGAIYNYGNYNSIDNTIGSISGVFIGNSTEDYGGAIYNSSYSAIGDITADFVDNTAEGSGGAIYNDGGGRSSASIGNITGDFIGNSAKYAGGAIYNAGNMAVAYSNIDNPQKVYDFKSTYYDIFLVDENGQVLDSFSYYSASEYNINQLKEYIAKGYKINFVEEKKEYSHDNREYYEDEKEYVEKTYIYGNPADLLPEDYAPIERPISINSNFIGNQAGSDGGAIYNKSAMSTINGDFIGNNAQSAGGAIYNCLERYDKGNIKEINGNFIGNYVAQTGDSSGTTLGGAIYNSGSMGNITGDFIGNYAKSQSGNAEGGAIYSYKGYDYMSSSVLEDISGDFLSNYAEGASANGGAIVNKGSTINNINGNFYLNEAKASSGTAFGGAVSNGSLYNISSQIGPYYGPSKMSIKGDFVQNSAYGVTEASGGAIANKEYYTWGQYGVAHSAVNLDISGALVENKAIASEGNAYGGAVYNIGGISFVNSSLINNHAEAGANGEAKGGGIYSQSSFTFAADGKTSLIQGNYVKNKDGNIENNAIYMDKNITYEGKGDWVTVITEARNTTVTLKAINNGQIIINDKIKGVGELVGNYVLNSDGTKRYVKRVSSSSHISGSTVVDVEAPTKVTNYGVRFTGDGSGEIQLNNNIEADDFVYDDGTVEKGRADVTLDGAHLHLATRADVLDGNNVRFYSGTFNMLNNSVGVTHFNDFQISGDTEFLADVDLKNKEMDRITADNYLQNSGNIIVSGMNLLNDAPEGQDVTEVYFAPKGFKDNVISGTAEAPNASQTTYYTPIYRYDVAYDKRENDGYFIFTRGGANTGNKVDNYNPSVLLTPTANLAAGQAVMNEAFKYVFEHADAFTQLPQSERFAKINQNKYAINSDFSGTYSPIVTDELQNRGLWVRPYTTFETMNLKNGPKVDAITYGTLIGFDSEFREMKNGWHNVFTGYLGYNGSQLNYSGVDSSMNGGLIGFTETFYKGNFWTAITASAGAAVSEAHTMYGKENTTSLLAGIGSKTGYNFEFKDGKFIVQPIMFLSYTFVNTFDYTNAAGVKIDSDPMHSIQLNPSVRFIANCKNGWQPYASVGMVWNLMNESTAKANNVKLPEMSIKPYVEYGVGVQRMWKDKYTAFLQGMVRNGGRNGIALTAGFRWTFGKDNDETVSAPKTKTVIKKLKKPMQPESYIADKR